MILFELLGALFARRSGVDITDGEGGFCLTPKKEKVRRQWVVSEVKGKAGIRLCVVGRQELRAFESLTCGSSWALISGYLF